MGGICSLLKRNPQEASIEARKNEEETEPKKKTVRFKEVVRVIRTSDSWYCDKCRKEMAQPRTYRTVAPDTDSTLNQVIQKLLGLPSDRSE